ncbi:hypothetical protein RUM43_008722 [Polyplax serrata]|uniref:Uncharacterized protein n=1 Tax=Polyplax serrata TaxID=468196 RepID=A0AAN8NNV9_POLSC
MCLFSRSGTVHSQNMTTAPTTTTAASVTATTKSDTILETFTKIDVTPLTSEVIKIRSNTTPDRISNSPGDSDITVTPLKDRENSGSVQKLPVSIFSTPFRERLVLTTYFFNRMAIHTPVLFPMSTKEKACLKEEQNPRHLKNSSKHATTLSDHHIAAMLNLYNSGTVNEYHSTNKTFIINSIFS